MSSLIGAAVLGTAVSGAAVATTIGAGAALYGANKQSGAIKDAANTSAAATDTSIAEQQRQFDIAQANQKPWLTAGTGALSDLQGAIKSGSYNGVSQPTVPTLKNFSMDPSQLANDPGYKFRLSQGLQATDRAVAGNGMLGSGNRLSALNDYAQGQAAQQYDTAFGQQQSTNAVNNQNALTSYGLSADQYNNTLNRLSSMAGQGQTTGTNLATLGQNYANSIGSLTMGNATNQAAAGIGSANAWGGALSDIAGIYGANSGSTPFTSQIGSFGDLGAYASGSGANYGGLTNQVNLGGGAA